MNYKQHFEGKKITVMGLGLLGRGVGDTKFLAEQGAELIVTDLKTEEELASSLEQLKQFSNITYRLGEHNKDDFKDRDYILKSADVPLSSLYIEEARKNNIPIKMSASWFMEFADIPTIGVTGTRGKSTVTHLLHTILEEAGIEVLLGGNVVGVSTLGLLPKVSKDSVALMELDSWQLQGFGDAQLSPDIAVFTTFMDDHLSYYKGDRDLYLNDKAQIFLHQKPNDVLVASTQVVSLLKEKYGSKIKSQLTIADPEKFPKDWKLAIPGEHNVLNVVCAIAAARALDVDDEIIKSAVEKFKGVPGRLELVRTYNTISIYNDTTATTPEATVAALNALKLKLQPITLILGGNDKGLDTDVLVNNAKLLTKKVVLVAGTGTDKIRSEFPEAPVYNDLRQALDDAVSSIEESEIILFSPGFTSFGLFKNEFDRGDQFTKLVNNL